MHIIEFPSATAEAGKEIDRREFREFVPAPVFINRLCSQYLSEWPVFKELTWGVLRYSMCQMNQASAMDFGQAAAFVLCLRQFLMKNELPDAHREVAVRAVAAFKAPLDVDRELTLHETCELMEERLRIQFGLRADEEFRRHYRRNFLPGTGYTSHADRRFKTAFGLIWLAVDRLLLRSRVKVQEEEDKKNCQVAV